MPRLTAVEFVYGSTLEVHFTTSIPLLVAADTAVLQVVDSNRGGSELGIRIERGHVSDVYLWDAGRKLRQRLPISEVVVSGRRVSCDIPLAIAPEVHGLPKLEAALIVNGAPMQSRFPVTLVSALGRPAPLAPAPSREGTQLVRGRG